MVLTQWGCRKGTWKHRVYIKGKPHQNGLKWFILADYDTYIVGMWLYHGHELLADPGQKMASLVADFAKLLPSPWNHRIACDSLFSGGISTAKAIANVRQGYILCCRADRPTTDFWKEMDGLLERNEDENPMVWRALHSQEGDSMLAMAYGRTNPRSVQEEPSFVCSRISMWIQTPGLKRSNPRILVMAIIMSATTQYLNWCRSIVLP